MLVSVPTTHWILTLSEPLFEWRPIQSLLLASNESNIDHLFVHLCSLHTHTKRLCALVALWTRKAVETWIGVDAALHSTHFVAYIRNHVTLKVGKVPTNSYKDEVFSRSLLCAHKKNRNLYLIYVFTVGTISTETSRTWATLPGSIWRTVAIHSAKAWVRQTTICKLFRRQETETNDGNWSKLVFKWFTFHF